MNEKELRLHNIALLYNLIKEMHPEDYSSLMEIAADYDHTISELKETLE